MLTPDGRRIYLDALAEKFKAAHIMVGDGQQRAEVPVEEFVWPDPENGTLSMSATFGEEVANFSWTERGIMLDGILVDHEEADGGRKILGASWTVDYTVQVVPEEVPAE